MSFPLASLLRVRSVQERAAAETLSDANAQVAHAEAAEEHARTGLAALSTEVENGSMLMAMAAARAAGRSALSDLQMLTELRRGEAADAKIAHVEARREVKGLERLELAHRTTETKALLHAEQTALDEIAIVRAARAS